MYVLKKYVLIVVTLVFSFITLISYGGHCPLGSSIIIEGNQFVAFTPEGKWIGNYKGAKSPLSFYMATSQVIDKKKPTQISKIMCIYKYMGYVDYDTASLSLEKDQVFNAQSNNWSNVGDARMCLNGKSESDCPFTPN